MCEINLTKLYATREPIARVRRIRIMATFALDVEGDEVESPEAEQAELRADLNRARRLADLLDAEFQIVGFRFGFDALEGLIPGIGDAVGFLAGLYPIHLVRKHKLGRRVEQRMIANLLIDAAGGAIPIIGDLFDVSFKANLRNIALLERAMNERPRQPRRARARRR